MRSKLKRRFLDYLGITIGSLIIALGLTLFLIPNKIAAGGVSGLATIIYYLTEIPVGFLIFLINIPLFIAGFKVLGLQFGARTFYGMFILAFFIDILQPVIPVLTDEAILAAVYGGILSGVGLGLVFYFRGTTGGTDLIARLINHYTGLSVGQGLLIADGLVVISAVIFFSLEMALYAILAIIINSKTIDVVQEGINIKKCAYIISDEAGEIRDGIINKMDRGVTILKGYGGYTGGNKDVIFCIITRSEITRLKRMVYDLDKEAFIIISTVHEVLGEGFKEIN